VGLGPVLFLAAELDRMARTASPAAEFLPPLFLAGFRTKAAIPSIAFPDGARICTDDGSAGFGGTPLDWVSHNVPEGTRAGAGVPAGPRVYACGPAPMLAAAARLARGRGWEASLSAEAWMACGVGACMGCALPRSGAAGYLRACHDGPVFGRDEIDWEAIR
jgi:dihydroorotate dehydrogenase electron transfer subunit